MEPHNNIADVQAAIATLKEHITDPKKLKALTICEAVINAADNIAKDMAKAYPTKRPFRKVDRRPLKRIHRQKLNSRVIKQAYQARIEIEKIVSTPLPLDYASGGIPMTYDKGPEYILRSEVPYKIPPLADIPERPGALISPDGIKYWLNKPDSPE